jgi:hypothetical protein
MHDTAISTRVAAHNNERSPERCLGGGARASREDRVGKVLITSGADEHGDGFATRGRSSTHSRSNARWTLGGHRHRSRNACCRQRFPAAPEATAAHGGRSVDVEPRTRRHYSKRKVLISRKIAKPSASVHIRGGRGDGRSGLPSSPRSPAGSRG